MGDSRRAGPGCARWTPSRRSRFLTALATTNIVVEAARAAGVSPQRAYELRATDSAFRARWEAARDAATDRLRELAVNLALNGVETVTTSGRKTVRRRTHDVRLIRSELDRAGRAAERAQTQAKAAPLIDARPSPVAALYARIEAVAALPAPKPVVPSEG